MPDLATSPSTGSPGADGEFSALRVRVDGFLDPANPTDVERLAFWGEVCGLLAGAQAAGQPTRHLRQRLLDWLLQHATFLRGSRGALETALSRKLSRWNAGGGTFEALAPRYSSAAALRTRRLSEKDERVLRAVTTKKTGGRVDQAWRFCLKWGLLSKDLAEPYGTRQRAPEWVRRAIKPLCDALSDFHHGTKQARLNGPKGERDWSLLHAGDAFESDDMTGVIACRSYDDRGDEHVTKGQFLAMVDERSRCIIGFTFKVYESYDSLTIRRLMTHTADKYGLPRRGYGFERGLWKSSGAIHGEPPNAYAPDRNTVSFTLKERFGIDFHHYTRAPGKVIEYIYGLIQRRMEGDLGYVGRNSRTEVFERVQSIINDRKSWSRLLTVPQLVARYHDVVDEYNNTHQPGSASIGKAFGNLTPKEAWIELQDKGNPPIKLPPDLRYWMACDPRLVRATEDGVSVQICGRRYSYWTEALTPVCFERRQVLLWFDPDTPDIATITDLQRKDPIVAPQKQKTPPWGATREQMKAHMRPEHAWMRYGNAIYDDLATVEIPGSRPVIASPEDVALGKAMEEGKARLRADQTAAARAESRRRAEAERLGIPAVLVAGNDAADWGLKRILAARKEDQ